MTIITVKTGGIAADAVTDAKIADDLINSEHYTDGSIDTAHLADGQVTIGKLATAVLTGATDIGAAIVDADLLLVDDGAGGTLRKTAASRLKTYIGSGLTVADQFRMTANNATDADITSNIERVDTTGQGGITGNQMSVSSGIFTFPLTGIYLVKFNCSLLVDGTGGNAFRIKVTTDNSNFTTIAVAGLALSIDQDTAAEINSLIDVTNTTNVKVKFNFSNFSGSNTTARGNTTQNKTFFTFIRLGDT